MQNVTSGIRNLYAAIRSHGWGALWAVLGLGLLLRIGVVVFYTPTVFNYYGGDSARYMRLSFSGSSGLFGDNAMPAGYPAFLAVLRHVEDWLPFTIMTQHLLGLAGAVLLYAAVRAVGAPRWAALLPVVVVALSGDELFLEHGIFTEALWMPLLALAMYLLARAISAERALWWLVAGGIALACSAIARNLSEALPILLAIWAAVALPGTATLRLRNALAVALPALAVLGAYLVVAKPIAGGFSGLSENSGFALYSRVAQFADCNKFTPPPGSEPLCVDTPPDRRPGPFYWAWSTESPLRSKFAFDMHDSEDQALLSRFAREALVHQPIEYAEAAGRDFVRFFAPDWGTPRPDSGTDEGAMSFESTAGAAQAVSPPELADQYEEAYSGVGDGLAAPAVRSVLGAYQALFRIDGRLLLLLIALGVVGSILGRGRARAGASLFLLSGLALLVIPPLFSSYDIRYTIPPINLFAASAAIGLAALSERIGREPYEPAGGSRAVGTETSSAGTH